MSEAELSPEDVRLIEAALTVRHRAYAPYSNFLVGAALQVRDGDVFTGVNVENASYGLTLCAERVAAASAVAAGRREITCVAVASVGGAAPCGACRQFLAEFGSDMRVLLVDIDETTETRVTTLGALLPAQFQLRK